MNNTLKELRERKSVRAFEKKEISQGIKDQIIDAAFQAPTAGAQMLYTILDITDPQLKKELSIVCDNQPFISKAPMVLIFLADTRRWFNVYSLAGLNPRTPEVGDFLLACQDAIIAAQNTVVAGHSLGIGSCYIGDIIENKERLMELLNLDCYTVPISMIVFGYPTVQQKERKKPRRFDKQYLVRENRYHKPSEEEMRAMFLERSGNPHFDFEKYITAFYKRKYESNFAHEMNRSGREYIEPFLSQKKL